MRGAASACLFGRACNPQLVQIQAKVDIDDLRA